MSSKRKWKRATLVTGAILVASLILLPACCCVRDVDQPVRMPQHELPPAAIGQAHFDIPEAAEPEGPTRTVMRNVHFWLASDLILEIDELYGTMIPKGEGEGVNFDDKTSFIVDIHHAEVGISGENLERLMNRYAFEGSDAPLRDLSITISDGLLHQEGILHKLIDIPFEMDASVSLTADGKIRIHPESIELCDLPGKSLMSAFGITLEEVMNLEGISGVSAEENDLLIDPLAILPPPTMRGRISDIRLEEGRLVQIFSSDEPWEELEVPSEHPNYMLFRHGTLRMGKLFMMRADMHVVDSDPSDPFEFFLDGYNKQLVAGFTQNLADYGLLVIMRDIDDLDRPIKPEELICREAPCDVLEVGPEDAGDR